MEGNEELERLRDQVRRITAQIMRDVHKRLELAEQIGEIKRRLGIDVKDERVEREIRVKVIGLAEEIGMSKDFALRLLNILLEESESVQAQERQQARRQTHLEVFAKAKQLEIAGKQIIHMEVGEPDYPPPPTVGDSLSESFKLKRYHYTDTRGIPSLRGAIAKDSGVAENNVIVTPGGRFAVFSAMVGLVRPGQEIIVVEPGWPAYKECASLIGAKARILKTRLEDGWKPDTAQLEDMINPATRMIVVNYPNNPTGKVLDKETINRMVSIAKEHNLYLLSDEVYADYDFHSRFHSVLEYGYDRSIMISSFSKRYAMTGFRVGYGVASEDIIAAMTKVQAVGITSVAEPMQHAAVVAMNSDYSENVRLMKQRLDLVARKLRKMSLRFIEPEGAMYLYPEVPAIDDTSLVERLLNRGVAIAPGSGFGDSYKNFVRISACQPSEVLGRGLDIMAAVLQEIT